MTDSRPFGLIQQNTVAIRQLSLGTLLRKNYAKALTGNPITNPPWSVVPAWAQNTAYAKGGMALNGNKHWVNVNPAGTSLGTGTGPSGTNAIVVADNNLSWIPAGDPQIAISDPLGPAVSTSNATNVFGSGTTVLMYPPLFPSAYRVIGAIPSIFSTNYWSFSSFNQKAASPIGLGFQVRTIVTDAKFAVGFTNGNPPAGIVIDGRFYNPQVLIPTTGTPNWVIFDFSATTGCRPREVIIVSSSLGAFNFAGIAVTPAGSVAAPAPPDIPAVIIADSYDAGSAVGPFAAASYLGTQIGFRLGWAVTHMATGGTGVIATGLSNFYTYPQRVLDPGNAVSIAAAKVVLIYGSTNDVSNAPSAITAAVTQTLNNIRTLNKTCAIFWIGPASINVFSGFPDITAIQLVDTAVAAAFAAWVDPGGSNLAFYTPFANAALPPIDGSYRTGSPANINTNVFLIYSGDHIHPSDRGTGVIAAWMAEQVASQYPAIH